MTQEAHSSLRSAAAAAARPLTAPPALPPGLRGATLELPGQLGAQVPGLGPLNPRETGSQPRERLSVSSGFCHPGHFRGFPSCDFSWPGSPKRPLCLPSALSGPGLQRLGGTRGGSATGLGPLQILLPLSSAYRPCSCPAGGLVLAPSSRQKTPALPSPPFSLRPFAAVSSPALGSRERQLKEEQGGGRRRGGVRAGWVGREPRGCGQQPPCSWSPGT